ncbi:hypothetical protein E6O75_ATG11650 [Venturia nashicola]|uniref:Uncharacterized protein n=1 Tax=Venturia nashicola TaxID=86259 RepID=A0A4Z1NTC4_9PEZI|nr:hypothetical protein E6O75_ATG11650 [Venturia nashicola]
MSFNDSSILSAARFSSKQAQPVSLTVRNPNIQPPQRRSSLKSSSTVRSSKKKGSRAPENEIINQSTKLKNPHQLASGSLLKVAKTRRNTENVPSIQESNDKILGKLPNVSVHSLLSEDLGRWKGADLGILRGNSFRSHVLKASPKRTLHSNADDVCLPDSRPSTAMSHSTTTSIPRQVHHRRDSVRRTVTKVFSSLNRKKRAGLSDPTKSSPESEARWLGPLTTSNAHQAERERARDDTRDSGVFLVGETNYPSAVNGAQDTEDSVTSRIYHSPGTSIFSGYRDLPSNSPPTSFARLQSFRGSSESLLSEPGYPKQHPSQAGHRPKILGRKRNKWPTLRVRLAAKAELKEASLTSEDAIWAMVQIHGEVTGIASQPLDTEFETSIAVAIVLDNSCLATMKDIEKASLEIVGLSGRLQENVDRLGVFCTAFATLPADESPDCCVVSLSKPLDREQLSNRLKRVAKQSQRGYHLETALGQAAQALHELDEAQAPTVRRDIIVISPNPVGLTNCIECLDDTVSVHIFNPGLVPFGILDDPPHPGSQSDTRSIEDYSHSARSRDRDYGSIGEVAHPGWVIDATTCVSRGCNIHGSHSLHDVVAHAKAQTNTGSIANIGISITPGANVSSIVEILGKLDYSVLLPGQIISIPIKVRLKSLACRLSHVPLPSSSRRSVTEAITDLELTLGEHLSELFRVQVRYSHSMFPENTTLVAQESCWLRRTLKRRVARGDDTRRESVYECMVQRQLALSLAGHGRPIDALNALETEFDSKPVPPYCSEFVGAVKDRLRHRISQSPFLTACVDDTEDDSYEAQLQEFVDGRERQELDTDDSPSTVVRRRIVHTPDLELHDTARRIWQHIRKTSRPGREIGNEMEPDEMVGQVSNAQIEEIRRMAMKNKRKMSTETLKSLARDYTRFSTELGGVDELSSDDVD